MDKSFAAAACRVWCAAVLELRDAMVRDPHVCSLARDRATLFALGGLAKQPLAIVPATIDDLASQATAPSHVLDSESLLSQPSVLSTMAIRAPSPSRFIKLPGPARTPPRTPADEYW